MKPTLSILTPAIWSRHKQAEALAAEIAKQAEGKPVEHLVLFDNRNQTVGAKRNACLRAASGDYIVFVDDDDAVEPQFVDAILSAVQTQPDFVTYRQKVVWNGQPGEVQFHPNNPDEGLRVGGVTRRNLWHTCTWRRDLVAECVFPHIMDGEDFAWAVQARQRVSRGVHIDKVLCSYYHDEALTAATGKDDI